jgi:acetyl esterase/lipase
MNRFRSIALALFALPLVTAALTVDADEPATQNAVAQDPTALDIVPLWEQGPPGFEGRKDEAEEAKEYWVKNVHQPSLTVVLPKPDIATGQAVVICPGGGHRLLVYEAEGLDAARYLAQRGIAAFVLKYRLAREENSPYDLKVHPREDALRALRLVRHRAAAWNVQPDRLGMIGFSAGGEVVAEVAYRDGAGDEQASDPIDRLDGRPNYQILIYPGPLGIPDAVPPDAPPALLICAADDGLLPVTQDLSNKYQSAKRPFETHILSGGGHGFNMGRRATLAAVKHWPERMIDWLADLQVPAADQ